MPHGLTHHHHHKDKGGIFFSRVQGYLSLFFHKLALVPFALILVLLGVMPLLYNGGLYWWLPASMSILYAVYACWALSAWWCGGDTAKTRFHGGILLFVLPILLGIVQVMPCQELVRMASPAGWKLWQDFGSAGLGTVKACISLAPDSTYERCTLLTICLLTFFYIVSQAHHRLHLKLILAVVTLAALGNAVLSYTEFFRGGQYGMANLDAFTGTFLNRNHFGFLMMMGILSSAGLMAVITSEHKNVEEDWRAWQLMTIPLAMTMFALLTSLVLSLSRGAFMGAVAGLTLFGSAWLFTGHDGAHGRTRQRALALLFLVSAAVVLALPYAMQRLSERYDTLLRGDLTMDGRWLVWKDSCSLIGDYWRMGAGLGAYADAIQPYESGNFSEALIEHAHNDYLEMIAETGVPFAAIILILGICLWFVTLHRVWRQHDKTYRWGGLAALSAILGGAIHEFVEFNLLAWSNALLFSVLMSVACVCGRNRTIVHGTVQLTSGEQRAENRKGRWKWRLALIPVSMYIFTVLLPGKIAMLYGAAANSKLADEIETEKKFAWKAGPGDFKRRLSLAEIAAKSYPEDHDILRRSALTKVEWAMVGEQNAPQLWKEACEDIAKSCGKAPGDGDSALICAKIYEAANLNHQRYDSDDMLMGLYARALRSQPTIANTAMEHAMACYRFYRKSLTTAPGLVAQRREMALKSLSHWLDLQPNANSAQYAMLFELASDFEQLISLAPGNYAARRKLLSYLVERNALDEALSLMDIMREQLPQLKDNEDYLDIALDWHSERMTILEIQGRQGERAQEWHEMTGLAAERKNEVSKKLQEYIDSGHAKMAEKASLDAGSLFPMTAEYIMTDVRVQAFLGHRDGVIHSLVPLTYLEDAKPSAEILREAMGYLQEGDWRETTALRVRYLKNALTVILAESNGDNHGLSDAISRLEAFERDYKGKWLQMHMAPYFAGRAYELLGQNNAAAAAYRRSLVLCPKNLYVLRRMERVGNITEEEASLLEFVKMRKSPICAFSSGVIWLNYRTVPQVVKNFHDNHTLEYLFLCTGDLTVDMSFSASAYDSIGRIFSEGIDFMNSGSTMLTWRVGELISVARSCQPMVKALNASRRVAVNGDVTIELSAAVHGRLQQALPRAVTKAYKIELE